MAIKDKATWRDPELGVARELELPQGRLRCFEAGSGFPIVFAHGLLVNANLWRTVVATLSPESRASELRGAPRTGLRSRVDVAKRTTLNALGVVPLALGIPVRARAALARTPR